MIYANLVQISSTLVTSLFTWGLNITCIYWHSKYKISCLHTYLLHMHITKYSVVLLHHIYPIVDG